MAAAAQPTLPEPPAQLKAVQAFIKMAQDVERVDPVVSYWVRLHSTEMALKIDRDSPESKAFLSALILYLEKFKSSNKDNETVSNQTVGQAHYENFVMALFNKADTLDREGTANKSTVRMFFMAAILFEAMAVFGPLTDDVTQKAKYAKFKAAYITKCLKSGQTPKPGPIDGTDLEAGGADGTSSSGATGTEGSGAPKASDSSTPSTTGDGSVFNLPEIPKDADAFQPAKPPQDPFILTPSKPPDSVQPKMPPSLPPGAGGNYSTNMPATQPSASLQPQAATTTSSTIDDYTTLASNGAHLKPEDIVQCQKFCKFAGSALQYDDIPTAVLNLQKALKLLTTGEKQAV